MLGSGFRALSVDEVTAALVNILHFVNVRKLPVTSELDLERPEGVRRALDALVENDVVSRFTDGPEAVYRIGPEQQLEAAYYRNTVIHFFVNAAIAELSLLRAADAGMPGYLDEFWMEAMRLRDLLKFEFFFAEKEIFRDELREELARNDLEWESRVMEGPAEIQQLLGDFRPFSSHRVLRPFLEAYLLVAEKLASSELGEDVERDRFIGDCMGLGKQYHLQRRIHSAASISQMLFGNALSLAENREPWVVPSWKSSS